MPVSREPSGRRPIRSVPWLLLFLLLLAPASCSGQDQEAGPPAGQTAQEQSSPGAAPSAIDLVTAIEQVARQTIPAVVHIEVTERQEVPHPLLPFLEDPFFRRFFDIPQVPEKFEREVQGIGTGMLMDAQGHILTNYHVAGGATQIQVFLADGRRFEAELVGGDANTDLAVVRIKADAILPHVNFGDSDHVSVGEWVVAIGHPRGLNQTVTQGIISAMHRSGITDPSNYQDFLQTDAAINPGNSGGPLLNLRGEVIGVNAAIASVSGGFEGIGFAIPSNMALFVARQLIEHGEVSRGWLGVSVQQITPDLATAFGLKEIEGALVADVMEDSPAAKAGLQKGDVIVSYRGKEIADADSLRNEVAVTPINEEVPLTIIRDGGRKEVTARIGSLKEAQQRLTSSVEERLGAEFEPVPESMAATFNLEPNQGVVVTGIDPDGPLGRAGFENNDLILAVNDQPIGNPQELVALIQQVPPGRQLALLALDHRTGRTGYIRIQLR